MLLLMVSIAAGTSVDPGVGSGSPDEAEEEDEEYEIAEEIEEVVERLLTVSYPVNTYVYTRISMPVLRYYLHASARRYGDIAVLSPRMKPAL